MPIQHPSKWKSGTAQQLIAERLIHFNAASIDLRQPHPELLERDAYRAFKAIQNRAFFGEGRREGSVYVTDPASIRGLVGREPLIFANNAGTPYPIGPNDPSDHSGGRTQRKVAHYRTAEVLKSLLTYGLDGEIEEIEIGEEIEEIEEIESEEVKVNTDSTLMAQAIAYTDWIQGRARPYFATRIADGEKLDEWGMRQALDAVSALHRGLPIDFLKDSHTLHLPDHAREALGVTSKFDYTRFRPQDRIDGFHFTWPTVKCLIEAGLNIMFVGGKGTGKSTYAEKIAQWRSEQLGYTVKMTAVSCNPESGAASFFGLQRFGGEGLIIESDFSKLLREPSVILLDEIDASDPAILLMLNRVTANRVFKNELTQEEFQIHPDCLLLSGGNTFGNGADSLYDRERQDAAAYDRWIKIRVDIDEKLERFLVVDKVNKLLAA